MIREIGTRVYALRNSDQDTIYSFGVGIYVGDRIPPWIAEVPDEETRQTYAEFLRAVDAQEIPVAVKDIDWMVEKGILAADEADAAKAEAMEAHAHEKTRPLDERLQEMWNSVHMNPCIELDSGDVVFGAQCWWGPESQMPSDGRKVQIVPVPDMSR